MGIYSHKTPELGLHDGKLSPCPNKPNCVCSEGDTANAQNNIQPLSFVGMEYHIAWTSLINAVKASGGSIQQHSDTYLHATFTSTLFRFVDDFEARLDTGKQAIQIRSASRVGHSDLGANRKRVEKIRAEYDRASAHRKDPSPRNTTNR